MLADRTEGRFMNVIWSLRICKGKIPKGLTTYDYPDSFEVYHRCTHLVTIVQEKEVVLYFKEQGRDDSIPLLNLLLKELSIPYKVKRVERVWYLESIN